MPKRPKAQKPPRPDTVPTLFINICKGTSGLWYGELINQQKDSWTIVGPGKKDFVITRATRFSEFSGLPLYMEGERFDGLKPTLMKGKPE